ncbi:Cysteine protease atg4 [Cadophora gregata]|uniref:Cysteine protease atg4 n=1 Tax=Cadophora gregata TaxID=51156 RepID=UPI0026DA9523|nr:Cysteine protease atg4 [Cadophora gregata]KAK0101507.1 Cysteine protease atg4 [Cadophora gregata]KAK0106481.1 Cysteine protease atg4 [Cadophora gregata f. sp. sojae]
MTTVDFGKYRRIVQYFWDPEPTNDTAAQSPIWCLGKQYKVSPKLQPLDTTSASLPDIKSASTEPARPAKPATPPDSTASSIDSGLAYDEHDGGGGWPLSFLDDFEARIWLTYRSNFPTIPRSQDPKALSTMSLSVRLRSQLVDQAGFTSDTGWGCMIRSGQSLLANALVMLRMGREWRRGSTSQEEREIISLFADNPKAPYSIHKFVEHGATACGKHPGEWFGPSATARCIQALTNDHESSELRVYLTGDGLDVYEDTFMRIAKPDGKCFMPTLILVGTRLGLDKITPVYWEALKSTLQMPQSIGIAGGQPSSSHYFIGVQGQYFFYLDPHQTRPALPLPERVEDYSQEDIETCHTRRLRRIHIKEMDPSMLIAFLIRDEKDWKEWRQAVREVQGKAVIHVAEKEPPFQGLGTEREGAIDEVETFDDEDDDTILNA